ncbi:hypothetical protein [Streptomyces sp. NBC_00059]|uniref:hypothetical protein n=1 Tax=Streptomyces sp. NBC_00059 TaxID=2975635 RepID=UPI00224DCC8C|nr:hypothetical protein [Streptomyces sp. NBC_00059]MCX5417715.1 hypothetical protein [Streptomyces sp. NBC_00059]
MPSYEPDFRLDGYEAVNNNVAEQFWGSIGIEQDDMTVLAEHHSADGEHSFFVMHNRAVTWGIPGEPQIAALHLKRDPATCTFRFASEMLPLPSMAQSWLVARGCPRGGDPPARRYGHRPRERRHPRAGEASAQ